MSEELRKRQRKNPSYSLRAFARDLGVSASRLSEVLNSKVGLSDSRAAAIADRLQLPEDDKAFFIDLVQSEHARSPITKKMALSRVKARLLDKNTILDKHFSLISDWHNLAVLELLEMQGIEHTYEGIARQLGITLSEAQLTIDRLKHVGLVKEDHGQWKVSETESTTSVDVPSDAIQSFHAQMLNRAIRALKKDPVERRDFSSVVFTLNSTQLEYAKSRISEFRRILSRELSEMDGKDKLYSLSIQLFELKGDEE
ncbi:MAG: TIGR02147 family protein [Bdellovibrio sp.]|nr:TIGR02147 family protein [Bdellovibrio sp.]